MGASTDDKHKLDRNNTFFPELATLHDSLLFAKNGGGEMCCEFEKKFKRVTIWDRAFGGTTLLLHADGATPPGMPVQPEYLKAYGYLPPQFVGDEADTHVALAHIAQLFIEHISTRTVDRFMEAGWNYGWVFTQTGHHHTPFHPTRLIPIPTGTKYLFCGRPMGSLAMGRLYELKLQLAEEHSAHEQLEVQLKTQAEQMAVPYHQIKGLQCRNACATPVPTPSLSRVQAPSMPSCTSRGALSVGTWTTLSITSPSPPRHSSTLMPEDIVRYHEEDQAVLEWVSKTFAKADKLTTCFKCTQHYFLNVLFQGGVHMVNHQDEVNPYNTWKTVKAAEPFTSNTSTNTARSLTKEEKKVLKDGHTIVRDHVVKLIGLDSCVGTEGFFFIVWNNTDFHIKPQWYFTSPELEDYMQIAVGSKLEAFVIAGCDIMNLLLTSKQKADYIKCEICDEVRHKLYVITGRDNVEMQYVNYEENIVLTHGVNMNPSELSTVLAPLQELLAALKADTCTFVKLTAQEHINHEKKYEDDAATGCRLCKQREHHSDFGKKRKAVEGSIRQGRTNGHGHRSEDSDNNDTASSPAKRSKWAPLTEVQPPPHTAPTKKAGPAKKKPAVAAKKTPTAKKAAAPLRCDDNVTCGVIAKIHAEQAVRVKSRLIIMLDDETDPEPYTDAGLGSTATAVPANGTTVFTNAAAIPANAVVAPTAT
ncbi:hypothetical protein B0H14DRAFT_2615904 [Mycena olivaceomarginata]|nr:hypothetical protein B0H14DRAFT_2615904 [Mycena olivaceomarginata]